MEHAQMDFEIQILLGCCHYSAADAGEILAMVERIPSGDFEKWYQEWFAIAERMQGIAEQSASSSNPVSARKAFLRAATYFSASAIFIDGTKDTSRGLHAWKRHLTCWERFCFYLNPAAEKVSIPYEGIFMSGYFFRPDKAGGPSATIIFNNGSDGSPPGCGLAAYLRRLRGDMPPWFLMAPVRIQCCGYRISLSATTGKKLLHRWLTSCSSAKTLTRVGLPFRE